MKIAQIFIFIPLKKIYIFELRRLCDRAKCFGEGDIFKKKTFHPWGMLSIKLVDTNMMIYVAIIFSFKKVKCLIGNVFIFKYNKRCSQKTWTYIASRSERGLSPTCCKYRLLSEHRDSCEKCYCLHLCVLSTSQARTTFIYFHVHYRLKKITIAAFERIHLNIKTTCLLDLSWTILTMTKTMAVLVSWNAMTNIYALAL